MNAPARPETMFRSLNPATGEQFGSYRLHDGTEVEAALARSFAAWGSIRAAGIERRAQLLLALADRLEANLEALARLMTLEMGKPINEARGEIRKCASTCRTTAELGPGWLEPPGWSDLPDRPDGPDGFDGLDDYSGLTGYRGPGFSEPPGDPDDIESLMAFDGPEPPLPADPWPYWSSFRAA